MAASNCPLSKYERWQKQTENPCSCLGPLHSYQLSYYSKYTMKSCQVWLLVKAVWYDTEGVMDRDNYLINLSQMGVSANDWHRRLVMQGSLQSSKAVQHLCFHLLSAIHSYCLTPAVLHSLGGMIFYIIWPSTNDFVSLFSVFLFSCLPCPLVFFDVLR